MRTLRYIAIVLAGIMAATVSVAQDADTLAAVSAAMDNPVGELLILQNQLDVVSVNFPRLDEDELAYLYKVIPTFPVPINDDWNLISRVILQYNSVPINEKLGDLVGFSLDQVSQNADLAQTLEDIEEDPFDETTGFGDLIYLGLMAPKVPKKTDGGTLLWGVGPSLMLDTAEEEVLGTGANSAGFGALLAYITEKTRLGILPMQFWSYDENEGRGDVNMLNMQYFAFYSPDPTTSIGMMPNITVNWDADSGEKLTLPVGLGINKTMFLGKLPVRIGAEFHYNVVHPDDNAHGEWTSRFFFVPVMPAPGSDLAKSLKK